MEVQLTSRSSKKLSCQGHRTSAPVQSADLSFQEVPPCQNVLMQGNAFQEISPNLLWEKEIIRKLEALEEKYEGVPLFQRLEKNLVWWQKYASPEVLRLIREGVRSDHPLPQNLSKRVQQKSQEEITLAQEILILKF